jgi:osmotically inducible protein OsmC
MCYINEENLMIKKIGSAVWKGDLKQGEGTISTESGALKDAPYSLKKRFEGEKGANPEELIGAAHAACFSMAFSAGLDKAGFKATQIATTAEVSLDKVDNGFVIPAIHLTMKAQIPNIDQTQFETIANDAKANCPVSKVLNAKITLDAQLEK